MNCKSICCILTTRLSRNIANHLFGPNHTSAHKMVIGAVILLIGVSIAKAAHMIEFFPAQIAVDAAGYSIHGMGLAPFLEVLMKENSEG